MALFEQTPAETEAELRHRHALEATLLAISTRLLNASAESLDDAITDALRALAETLGASRIYSFAFDADRTHMDGTHEYVTPGRAPVLARFKKIPTASMSWSTQRLLRGELVVAASLQDLPPEAAEMRARLEAQGLAGYLTVPMTMEGRVVGGLAFDWMDRAVPLSTLAPKLMRVAAELISGALGRRAQTIAGREQRDRLRGFVATTPDPIVGFLLASGGVETSCPVEEQIDAVLMARAVECNLPYATFRGAAACEDLHGKTLRELTTVPEEAARALLRQFVARGYVLADIALRADSPRGPRDVVMRTQGVLDGGRLTSVWVQFHDMTDERRAAEERRTLEAALAQSQKMESIGVLAGAVAHDFNNILLVIRAEAGAAREELDGDGRDAGPEAIRHALGQIELASDRAAVLTRQLLAFSRRQQLERRAIDAGELMTSLWPMLRRLVREEVSLELSCPPGALPIDGDPTQLEQVVVNLTANAADAISGVGEIHIAVAHTRVEEAQLPPDLSAKSGEFVRISVTDTGAGIPPELHTRVFEPFFTTKPRGKGTGLGLAMVYGVVKEHDGWVQLDTAVARGTTIHVYLPARARPAPVAIPAPKPARAPGGQETILVAEHDDLVRSVVDRILRRAGYTVLLARNGAEACALFDAERARIALVFLDAVMPLVTGLGVYQHVRAQDPELPVLVSSGYSEAVFTPDKPGDFGLLPKPYEADALLRSLRAMLDAP